MLTIDAPCPRCLAPHTTLQLAYADPAVQGSAEAKKRETAFRCAHCRKLVAVVLEVPQNLNITPLQPGMHGQVQPPTGDIREHRNIRVIEMLPKMPKDEAPEHLPPPLAGAFLDGVALLQQRRWTPAAGSFRTAIDRATQLLWKDAGEGDMPHNLGKRIEKLAARLVMPGSLVAWADLARGVGNEVHALEEVNEDDARDAGHFTEVFLTYAYTLPERLEIFQRRRDEAKAKLEAAADTSAQT